MWETAALLLAAVGGFVFSLSCTVTRISILRSSGQALFFRAVFWGYVFFQSSCIVLWTIRASKEEPFLSSMKSFWIDEIDIQTLFTALTLTPSILIHTITEYQDDLIAPATLALILGSFLWLPVNFAVKFKFPASILIARQIDEHGTELEKMLYLSLAQQRMLLITLDSGKVYAGWVIRTPALQSANNDPGVGASLLCFMSGYRCSSSRQVRFTTDYRWLYEAESEHDIRELETFIPLSRVVTATWFRPELWEEFQNHELLSEESAET